MTLNLKFILITELALLLNFSGLLTGDKDKTNDTDEKKAKKLTRIHKQEFSIRPVFNWNEQYERTLEYIKDHEGFAGGYE